MVCPGREKEVDGGRVGVEPRAFTVWRRRARLGPPAWEDGCMIPPLSAGISCITEGTFIAVPPTS